jgi:hypothetical protein
MEKSDYTTTIEVSNTSNEVYTAINNVHLWWTENFSGSSKSLNDEFTVTFGETFITLKVTELVNNYKVVWLVTNCHKHFLKNKKEWVDTKICFEIANVENERTKITFRHIGLQSPLECYEVCCDAWNGYLQGSLKAFLTTGTGTPDKKV